MVDTVLLFARSTPDAPVEPDTPALELDATLPAFALIFSNFLNGVCITI